MSTPNAAHLELARRLLTSEGASVDCAVAAERVYEGIEVHLAVLLGSAGVRALFVRSAKLARLEPTTLESSCRLREHLQSLDPALAQQTAETLFATFFGLVTTFIGERLTAEVLRRAWPTDPPPGETKT